MKKSNHSNIYPRSDAGSPMVVNNMEMDWETEDQDVHSVFDRVEGDHEEVDITTTVIEKMQNGVDGNILPPTGDGSDQKSDRPSKKQYASEWAEWLDNRQPRKETGNVPQKPTDTNKLTTQPEKEVQSVGVCETETAPS